MATAYQSSAPLPSSLSIQDLTPKKHEKFSPNLHRWLTARGNSSRVTHSRVYRLKNGTRWIGYLDEDFFIGARLMGVLCNGRREDSAAYPRAGMGPMEEDVGFWDRYLAIGRCAIDPEHREHFINAVNRFIGVSKTVRCCNWCGQRQVLKRWVESVKREKWENGL